MLSKMLSNLLATVVVAAAPLQSDEHIFAHCLLMRRIAKQSLHCCGASGLNPNPQWQPHVRIPLHLGTHQPLHFAALPLQRDTLEFLQHLWSYPSSHFTKRGNCGGVSTLHCKEQRTSLTGPAIDVSSGVHQSLYQSTDRLVRDLVVHRNEVDCSLCLHLVLTPGVFRKNALLIAAVAVDPLPFPHTATNAGDLAAALAALCWYPASGTQLRLARFFGAQSLVAGNSSVPRGHFTAEAELLPAARGTLSWETVQPGQLEG
mmetsp:Transcript_42703/g.99595  ORF Transcript_42703/g.99595 Transcript_42703/m.99595 type:complete len:260 (-) Transcript_42703:1490-2269(-)